MPIAMARAVAELLAGANGQLPLQLPPQEVAFLAAALADRGLGASRDLREAFDVNDAARALEADGLVREVFEGRHIEKLEG